MVEHGVPPSVRLSGGRGHRTQNVTDHAYGWVPARPYAGFSTCREQVIFTEFHINFV